METISVRMDTKELGFLSRTLDQPTSDVIRDLFHNGKIMKALQLYKQKKISLGLAAKIAGLPLGSFIDTLQEYGLTINLELDDAKQALQYAKELL